MASNSDGGGGGGGFNPLGIPVTLKDLRSLWSSVDWQGIRQQVRAEANAQIVIVGPVNSGKSTLFNLLQGGEVSEVSPIGGTTRRNIGEQLGPFTLVDTPGFGEMGDTERANTALAAVRGAGVVIMLLDAAQGLREGDIALYRALRKSNQPVVVVLNKVDLLHKSGLLRRGGDQAEVDKVVADMSNYLATPVIPISAKTGNNVAERLIPAVLAQQPAMAVAIGRELPAFRRMAAQQVIKRSMLISTIAGAEPIPFIDIPIVIAKQVQMVTRLAAVYGEPLESKNARELMGAILGGLSVRYLAQQGAKFAARETVAKVIPIAGNIVAASFAAAGTWAIGQAVAQYYESGKRLSMAELNATYNRLLTQRPFSLERKQGEPLPDADEQPEVDRDTRRLPGRN